MSRLNILFLAVFVAVFVGVTLFQPDAVQRIQRGAMRVFSPFMRASTGLDSTFGEIGGDSLTPVELRARLDQVMRERDRLRLEVLQLDELMIENRDLRRALQYVDRSTLSLVPCRIISRKPANWYNTVVINKGARDGIQVDNPVVVPVGEQAALVGKISEVRADNTSVVLLLTDEICQVSAKLEGTREQGIVSGERGMLRGMPNLRLRYLSKEAEADPGTVVITSGTGELFPPNLLLGEVVEVETGAIDAEATIRPVVDFDELSDVFVILPRAMDATGPGTDTSPQDPDGADGAVQPAGAPGDRGEEP